MCKFGIREIVEWTPRNHHLRPSAIVHTQQGLAFAKLIPDAPHVIESYQIAEAVFESGINYQRLRLPKILSYKLLDDDSLFVVLEYLNGSDFEEKWHLFTPNLTGGQALSLSSIQTFLDLLLDLRRIPITVIPSHIPEITRSSEQLVADAKDYLDIAIHNKKFSPKVFSLAEEILETGFRPSNYGQMFPSNADFQFRNFLELDVRTTALVDLDNFRFSPFEAELTTAYQWTLMWNNPHWRREFIREAKTLLNLNEDLFRASLIEQSLRVLRLSYTHPQILQTQVDTINRTLNDFDSIWNP